MNEARRVVWLGVFVAAMLLIAQNGDAQVGVTPVVKPTPAGQLIVVNNTAGADHNDPHVSGDLVAYSNSDGTNFTIRYFDLVSLTDNGIPNGTFDFLSDVRGSTIAFTRVSASESAIYTFDASASNVQLIEVAPQPGASRQAAQIGDRTIVWQYFGLNINSVIAAYDRTSGTTTELTNDFSQLNQEPAISPDGTVVVWEQCANVSAPCITWKATLANGTWTAQPLVSQVGGNQLHPDTDGAIIAYAANFGSGDQLVWQPVGGGIENVLSLSGGNGDSPSVSGGSGRSLIAFSYLPKGVTVHDLAIYNPATNVLYDITKDAMPGNTADKELNDISVTSDGRVRVVWQQQDPGNLSVYAYTFNLPVGDFNLSAIAPLSIAAGASASTNVSVNPVNGFSSAVNLTVSGQPAGVTATLTPNQVTPSGGNPAGSVLNVTLPSFITPTNFTLTITGTSGTLSHSASADVTVMASAGSTSNLIGDLLGTGCIDNAGIGTALTSKLAAAQSAGSVQAAINTLTALKNQINAQAGKHIATSCTIAGVTFNPVTALLLDVQGLIDSLRVSLIADPITGYVVNSSGAGVAGALVSIVDANGNTVATAMTDVTGFYYMATTGVLSLGANYSVQVSAVPAGFTSATPANQPFTWQGRAASFADFVLN